MASESGSWSGTGDLYEGESTSPRQVEVIVGPGGMRVRIGDAWRDWDGDAMRVTGTTFGGQVRVELGARGVESPSAAEAPRAVLLLDASAQPTLRRLGLARRALPGSPVRKIVAGVAVLALVVFVFLRYAVDGLAGAAVRLVPEETEAELGRRVFDVTMAAEKRASDPELQQALDRCAAALDVAPLQIALVEDSIPNAFAIPGGYVVLHRGLVDLMQNENELLGVLAHEAGHVQQRHGLHRIARTALLGFVVAAIGGDASGLAAIVLDNSSLLVNLAHDRREEMEADAFAIRVLHDQGRDTSAMADLLERLESGTVLSEFFSTHPTTADRIARLRAGPRPADSVPPLLTPEEWQRITGR
ncbi:MAG TPA: M48 family metallopeptidase [Candidatus Krumholzibacteria bacterium]|nr:M48 family metallopeptidase [Candidatus Krumholzibacteria bacterium]